MTRTPLRLVASIVALALFFGGCATTKYTPQVVARGELVLKYDGAFSMWAGGRPVARGLLYKGFSNYVRCVPAAHEQARLAERDGAAAVALSVLGGTFGVAGLGGLYGLYDDANRWSFLGGGIALVVSGAVLAGLGRKHRNSANGHAVDGMNFYNDAVGSLGATCADLRYPAPVSAPPPPAPAPELPAPPLAP